MQPARFARYITESKQREAVGAPERGGSEELPGVYWRDQGYTLMVSISEFWRLAMESRLFTTQQLADLRTEFTQLQGAAEQSNVRTLLEWLITRRVLSRYQAKILAGGRSGPFFYGDYKVYDRSEQGRWTGMFQAVHVGTGHPVLLQFLSGPVTQDASRWVETARRVQAATDLKHPYLAQVHELVDLVSFKFLVLEDPPGRCLSDQLAQAQRCEAAEACRLIREVALGLGELHGRQRIHGDLRPHNLWLTEDGHLKILTDPLQTPAPPSFGAATEDPELLSRADYLAPEFTRSGHQPDRLSDIYALGCVFYQLLSGRPPFAGGDVTSKLQRHAKQPIQPLEPLGVPQPIARVAAYMMAKNPSVRFPQAGVVAEQLLAFIDPGRANQQPAARPTRTGYESALQHKRQGSEQPGASPAPPSNRSAPATFPAPAPDSVPAGAHSGRVAAPALQVLAADGKKAATGSSSSVRTRTADPQNKTLWIGGGLAGAAVVIIGLLVLLNGLGGSGDADAPVAQGGSDRGSGAQDSGGQGTPSPPTTPVGTGRGAEGTTRTAGTDHAFRGGEDAATDGGTSRPNDPPRQNVVPDDGELLWAAPTEGPPIALNYFPPGGQIFLSTRPADLLVREQGRLVLKSLGPEFAGSRAAWEAAAGVNLEQVDHLLMGLFDNGEEFPRAFYAVWLAQPVESQALLSQWGNPAEAQAGTAVYYRGSERSYWIPGEPGGPTFLMGDEPEIQMSAELQGAVPPLRRGIAPLLAASDSQRHFTLLAAPSYLSTNVFRDGRDFYFGKPRPLREALEWFLGDDLQAGLVSMHFGDPFYWELRLYSSLNRDYRTLASELRDRIAEIPAAVERHIVGLNPHPYWRMVAFRYPLMVRRLHDQARIGVENEQAVINGVLPGVAAHNLVFGGEMLLGAGPATATAVAAKEPQGPKTVEEVLDLKMDLVFDQTSLEFSMRDLAADVNETHSPEFDFEIQILGDDLELAGITRNQQIRDFAQQGQSVADILTALVMKANPLTTVKEPSETNQKLIWVVGPDPDKPSRKIVLITTRTSAAAKNYPLPEPFRPKP